MIEFVRRHCRSIKTIFFIAFVLILQSNPSYANEHYEQGLRAYFDKDYEQAKAQWLQGAKQGEAKSMFNLGLLHEQGRVNNHDPIKAEEWFVLAGKSGYVPADYHLALRIIKNNGDKARANGLLSDAAAKGFAPAMHYLNGDAPSQSTATLRASASVQANADVNSLELSSSGPKASNGNSSKKYFSESWVLSKSPSDWTIQLLAFSDEAKVKAFIEDNKLNSTKLDGARLNNSVAYFLEKSNGKALYKLIYGAYQTKKQADVARQNLHADLKQHGPWLRSLESVQMLIKAQ